MLHVYRRPDFDLHLHQCCCCKNQPSCFSPNKCYNSPLTHLTIRYCWHKTSQHGGAHGGHHSSRVPSVPVQHFCLQQQQRNHPSVWHEEFSSVRQTLQTWDSLNCQSVLMFAQLSTDMPLMESRFLCFYIYRHLFFSLLDLFSVRGARRSKQSLVLLWDHIFHLRCQVQSQWTLHDDQRLLVCKDLGFKYGEQASRNLSGESGLACELHLICTFFN